MVTSFRLILSFGLFLFSLVDTACGNWSQDNDANKESQLSDLHRPFVSADELSAMVRHLRGGDMMYGGGGGGGHHGMMMHRSHGDGEEGMGLSTDEHQVIRHLFQHRHEIERDPIPIPAGFNVTTTSQNPQVAEWIQRHVHSMTHLHGRRIRQCDPLFRALFDHLNETDLQVEYLENEGVRVTHTGKTECAQELVGDHTRTVSRFVDTGNMRPDFDWVLPQQCSSPYKDEEEHDQHVAQDEEDID